MAISNSIRWTGIGPVVLVMVLVFVPESAAQGNVDGRRFLQTGVAAVPGVGLQFGYVGRHSFYTLEGTIFADGKPSLGEREGTLQVSGGLGAAIRPLGVVRTIGNADYPYDFDFGLRFGPSLFFTTGATRADKNQQFSLFFDLFLRFSSRFRDGRVFFLEAGTQQPSFRAGLWFGF